jgi:hypothetical protein
MTSIKQRLNKLEQDAGASTTSRRKGVPPEMLAEVERVAAVCPNVEAFTAYLKTLAPAGSGDVISFEKRRQDDAVFRTAARRIFFKVNGYL